MPFDEEKKFLEPWELQAKDGGILVVSVIRAALAQHLGRPVKASVVYMGIPMKTAGGTAAKAAAVVL